MPDHADSLRGLQTAVAGVARVFGKRRGRADWGDGLGSHHPAVTPGMTPPQISEIESRPARLPASALTLEECEYFFAHSGYVVGPAAKRRLRESFPYFLPRIAAIPLDPHADDVMLAMNDPGVLGPRLNTVGWQRWPAARADAVRRWLAAWARCAIRYEPDAELPAGWRVAGDDPPQRDVGRVLSLLLSAGESIAAVADDLHALGAIGRLRLVRALIPANESGLRAGWLWDTTADGFPAVPPAAQRPLVEYLLSRQTGESIAGLEPLDDVWAWEKYEATVGLRALWEAGPLREAAG